MSTRYEYEYGEETGTTKSSSNSTWDGSSVVEEEDAGGVAAVAVVDVDVPQAIYRVPDQALSAAVRHVESTLRKTYVEIGVMGLFAGMLMGTAAVMAVFLSMGVDPKSGPASLLVGWGFVTGFSLILLTGSLLFTELNLSVPMAVYAALGLGGEAGSRKKERQRRGKILRPKLCLLLGGVFLANAVGSLLFGGLVKGALVFEDPLARDRLEAIVRAKIDPFKENGTSGWFSQILSGVLANFLVGLAAYSGLVARTLPARVIGAALPVWAFILLNVAHSPANMGFFAAALIDGRIDLEWGEAIWWNVVPAAIGNVVGGGVLLAGPLFCGHLFLKNKRE